MHRYIEVIVLLRTSEKKVVRNTTMLNENFKDIALVQLCSFVWIICIYVFIYFF